MAISPTGKRNGFTLIELVIVTLIIGIVAAAAVPSVARSLSYYRADSAARRIQADLELARRRAKMCSASQSIEFDSDTYTLAGMPHLDHPGLDYSVDLAQAPYTASIVSVDLGGDGELVFDGYGKPDSDGAVVVQSGAYQKKVSVSADTGRITLE